MEGWRLPTFAKLASNIHGFGLIATLLSVTFLLGCPRPQGHGKTEARPEPRPSLSDSRIDHLKCVNRYLRTMELAAAAGHHMRVRSLSYKEAVFFRVKSKLGQGAVRHLAPDGTPVESRHHLLQHQEPELRKIEGFDTRVFRMDQADARKCQRPTPVSMEPSFQSVPDGVAIVHYKLRPESLLIGLTTGSRFSTTEVELPASEIAAITANWVALSGLPYRIEERPRRRSRARW